MKKTIENLDLKNKKVIIRVDFNVPMKDLKITDDNRIRMSLKTINYALDNDAKVILLSHLGRIKEEKDKEKNSLRPVANRLKELLKRDVIFIDETHGEKLNNAVKNLKPGELILVENTRFEDLDGNKESSNDVSLGKYWATLGDIFINDAFGTCHRAHASNVGIASNLPNAIGFLVKEELDKFSMLDNPKRPYTIILGGAKVSDKIGVIGSLAKKADHILIGGGMSYTFLKANGFEIGKSILDFESINFCKDMLNQYKDKIVLPVDSIVSKELGEESFTKLNEDYDKLDICLDIGPKTVKKFSDILKDSNTIVWNGPLGYFEIEKYSNGTKEILDVLSKLNKTVIIGGGDTASAAINFGYKDSFTHISTGGGASLELLEGKKLPGIEIMQDN